MVTNQPCETSAVQSPSARWGVTGNRRHASALCIAVLLLARALSAEAGHFASGPKLVGTGAVGPSDQGVAVALSLDGSTAIVGGYGDAAWVFTRSGGVWTQQDKLVGTDGAGQWVSVALSFDGNTAILGSSDTGAAWIFTRSGGVWSQQGGKLIGTGAVGSSFQGLSVDLSSDGNTAIVGGYGDDSSAGATWVFTRNGNVWTQQGGKLVGTGAIGKAKQGVRVALSSDGSTAIVGGHYDNGGAGAVWVFTRSSGVWTQQGGKLVGTGAIGTGYQGLSVAVSSDGNTAIVGSPYDGSDLGAAWVFTRSGIGWTQQGSKLVGTGAIGDATQGISVALSSDGNMAIVGGEYDNFGVGATWVFTRGSGAWSQLGNKLVGTGAIGLARQGTSVALSGDATTTLVGGDSDNTRVGAAWVFMERCAGGVASGDANGDGALNALDVLYLINFLFAGGVAPSACY
jgi:hypothetical protein